MSNIYYVSFLNARICCLFLTFMIVNDESLGFGLLAGQKKLFEVTFSIYQTFLRFNGLKKINTLIEYENNHIALLVPVVFFNGQYTPNLTLLEFTKLPPITAARYPPSVTFNNCPSYTKAGRN